MVTNYESRKNEILASYNTVEELIMEIKNYFNEIELPDPTENLKTLLEEIRNKAEKVKADKFKIMLAGESKSGKSTFINAYLGVELLPSDVKQCTSSIVEITCGDRFSVIATYADGREIKISDDKEAREFLKKNAALDDKYRSIPVPTINTEILVKAGKRALEKNAKIFIPDTEINAMLNDSEVKSANIHNLPDYNERIKAYIETKKDSWQDIVTKIKVTYPFGDSLRGIEIIDSPGVCARGGVGDITSQYIKNADAIIFLKPISGQALESTQFNDFLEHVSTERNKNVLFLVLTRATNVTEAELRQLEEETHKQFSNLEKNNILIVDSKAALFAKIFEGIDDIQSEINRLKQTGMLDSFVKEAYYETIDKVKFFDTNFFINKLKEKSRFEQIDYALNRFGRKAHYIMFVDLLTSINTLYEKLDAEMKTKIDWFKQKKDKDPDALSVQINKLKEDLEVIQNKMYDISNRIDHEFTGDDGEIKKRSEKLKNDYVTSVESIDQDASTAFFQLELLCEREIYAFKKLTEDLQNEFVAKCDAELLKLSGTIKIPFISLKPDFTKTTFEEIKQKTKDKGIVIQEYEEGTTFKETHTRAIYVQNNHFRAIKKDIDKRLTDLQSKLKQDLHNFVNNVHTMYDEQLVTNARAKQKELDAIKAAKVEDDQIRDMIKKLSGMTDELDNAREKANKLKGGISNYVQ